MRLTVKRGGNIVNELQFSRGPVYIGRQIGSQVFLPDRAVSRQHAVIYTTTEGKWILEDLDSVNKTFLNERAVHKEEIKDGDLIRIADFTIDLTFEQEPAQGKSVSLEDTLITSLHEPQKIVRPIEGEDVPVIRIPAKRAKDFYVAACEISKAATEEKLLSALLDVMLRQFTAFHTWGALRIDPAGSMVCHAGRKINRQTVDIADLPLKDRINTAIEKQQYLLIPRVHMPDEKEKIRSAIIAPVLAGKACLGVLYADNALEHEHYSMSDLDYLMMLSLQAAAILQNMIHD